MEDQAPTGPNCCLEMLCILSVFSNSNTTQKPNGTSVPHLFGLVFGFCMDPKCCIKSSWSLLYFATLIPLIVLSCSLDYFCCKTFHYTHHQNQLSSEIKEFLLCFIFNCFQDSLIMCCFIISPLSAFNKLYLIYLQTHLLITTYYNYY